MSFESLRNASECRAGSGKPIALDVLNTEYDDSYFVYDMKYSKQYFLISKTCNRAGNYSSSVSDCILQIMVSNFGCVIGYLL